ERVELAAHHRGGIEAGVRDHGGDEAGGGGLAVAAGDGHALLEAHQLGQHLGAGDDGDAAGAGGADLGVRLAHGAGGDHHVDVVGEVAFAVADGDAAAQLRQAAGDVALFQVGAADAIAQVEQQLGDAAHADAADPDEV